MLTRRLRPILLSTALAATLALGPDRLMAETLADALVKAYQTSPLLESSRAALRSLDEGVPQARADRRPQVGAEIGANTNASPEDFSQQLYDLSAGLNASLLLLDNGQTRAAVEAARYRVAAGRADLKGVEQLVLFDAVTAYVNVRRDEEFVRLAQTDVERLQETLRATQNRFDVGEVTRTDVSQAESRLAESRSTLVAAQGALEIAREAYRAAVGVPPQNLTPPPPLPALPPNVDEAVALAVQRNPEIIAAQYNERVAVYDVDRAMAARGPSVSATASVGVQRGNQFQFDVETWDGDAFGAVGIEGSMPLYTGGRNASLVRQAQAILDQRRFELQDTGRAVTEDTASAWAELQVARASIIARREQAEAARIAAEGVSEEARLGARSTLDVLDADQERLEAEAEIVRALANEYVAGYAVLRQVGLLTVKHLGLGIETYEPDDYYARVQSAPSGGYYTSVVDRIRARWEK